jgi:hypothetical protein
MTGGLAGAPSGAVGSGPLRQTKPLKRRPDLPMDEASRMARAKEMGFQTDVPLYHGTDQAFAAFDPARQGAMTGAETARLGVWTARDPGAANEFAEMAAKNSPRGQQVYPLLYRADRTGQLNLQEDDLRGRSTDPGRRLILPRGPDAGDVRGQEVR